MKKTISIIFIAIACVAAKLSGPVYLTTTKTVYYISPVDSNFVTFRAYNLSNLPTLVVVNMGKSFTDSIVIMGSVDSLNPNCRQEDMIMLMKNDTLRAYTNRNNAIRATIFH